MIDVSKVPSIEQSHNDHVHNEIRIWMPIELLCMDQGTFMLRSLQRRSPARFRCCSWIEAFVHWTSKGISRWMVVDERGLDAHS
jgi:hypothetical protein